MVGSITLLSAVLSLLPPPAAPAVTGQGTAPRGSIGWVEATTLAARIQQERGILAEPVLDVGCDILVAAGRAGARGVGGRGGTGGEEDESGGCHECEQDNESFHVLCLPVRQRSNDNILMSVRETRQPATDAPGSLPAGHSDGQDYISTRIKRIP